EIERTDERGLQEQLQAQLQLRAQREEALREARNALEEAEGKLRETEQERSGIEQRLTPLRERINELRLKEQEARIAEENYAQQLAESGADEQALQPLLEEEGVRASKLQAEINRLNQDITGLGPVNMAALEE